MSFDKALQFVLAREGGYVDNPHDHGGATNQGITQRTYNTFRAKQGLDFMDVRAISYSEITAIYSANYWKVAGCNELPDPLDLVQFDSAVQHGPHTAIKLLQRALRITDDGVLGAKTIGAVRSTEPSLLIRRYLDERKAYYAAIIAHDPSQQAFATGWKARMLALSDEVSDSDSQLA